MASTTSSGSRLFGLNSGREGIFGGVTPPHSSGVGVKVVQFRAVEKGYLLRRSSCMVLVSVALSTVSDCRSWVRSFSGSDRFAPVPLSMCDPPHLHFNPKGHRPNSSYITQVSPRSTGRHLRAEATSWLKRQSVYGQVPVRTIDIHRDEMGSGGNLASRGLFLFCPFRDFLADELLGPSLSSLFFSPFSPFSLSGGSQRGQRAEGRVEGKYWGRTATARPRVLFMDRMSSIVLRGIAGGVAPDCSIVAISTLRCGVWCVCVALS
mmetsp:Transcript_7939/g.15810  ORF Transcript_7939/g.15810 Transcript_7939/m.15810 type:complete len:264 (-) Transcript_7939:45-836(-)